MSEHQFDPAAHARSMRASGFWVDKSFDEFLQQVAASLLPRFPKLQNFRAVCGEGPNRLDRALVWGGGGLGPPPIGEIGALPADQMAVLMFTSGTTGSPKGVMHCLNTLLACNIAL